MLKKVMTYTDYNGVERTEDFYFNLSKSEVMEMEMTTVGGLSEKINNIIAAKDTSAIITVFKDLILKAYGKKSLEGKRFVKSEDLAVAFSQTEAYSDLFMELATNTDSATTFVNGILPKEPISKPASQY